MKHGKEGHDKATMSLSFFFLKKNKAHHKKKAHLAQESPDTT
jgi:hypothetical protein